MFNFTCLCTHLKYQKYFFTKRDTGIRFTEVNCVRGRHEVRFDVQEGKNLHTKILW